MNENAKKTIAIISAFPPGKLSLNEYGYHLALNFAENPEVEKVIIIADQLPEALAETVISEKIEIIRLWKFNSILNLPKIAWALLKIRPDLALYNLQTASFGDREIPSALGLMTPFFTRMMGIRSGILAHNMISGIDLDETVLKGQKLRQKIVKLGASVVDWTMLHANYITFTLTSYTQYYKEKFPKANIYHIGHGSFDTKPRTLTPYQERNKTLVTMGKFGTYKRLETLLEAIEIVRTNPKNSDIKLIIGGTDHPNKMGYMASVEDAHGHKDYLDFHGYVAEDDIPEFFGQARIAVFDYSSTTGSSGVLHQTASYGAVPIFPAIGDFVDVCESEGLFGENYEPNDAKSMAKAIENILANDAKAIEIATANRNAADNMPMSEIVEFHLDQCKSV